MPRIRPWRVRKQGLRGGERKYYALSLGAKQDILDPMQIGEIRDRNMKGVGAGVLKGWQVNNPFSAHRFSICISTYGTRDCRVTEPSATRSGRRLPEPVLRR